MHCQLQAVSAKVLAFDLRVRIRGVRMVCWDSKGFPAKEGGMMTVMCDGYIYSSTNEKSGC